MFFARSSRFSCRSQLLRPDRAWCPAETRRPTWLGPLWRYGIFAPGALFAGKEAEVDQLTSEQIYRLASPGAFVPRGRFFHPSIAKTIYEAIMPKNETRRQAEDLARGFSAMLANAEEAKTFLAWLAGPTNALSVELKKETFAAMWHAFREIGPSEDITPLLKRWHEMAHSESVNLTDLGAARCVLD
jgi:hypothetical protein